MYHFNEGSGTIIYDAAAISGNNSDGYLTVGGSPAGPIWVLREGVPENLVVTRNVNDVESMCYNAQNTITVQDFNLASGGEVNFIAGFQIIFEPEVSIQSGSYMRARITQDGDYCTQQPAILNSRSKQKPDSDKKEPISTEFHADMVHTFPNPSNGIFTLAIPEMHYAKGLQIQIYNSQRLLVYDAFTIQASPITINISWLPAGVYFICSLAGERVMSGKISIN